jgi:hypothetical protein
MAQAPHGSTDRLMNAAFAPDRQSRQSDDPLGDLIERETFRQGGGPVRWTTNSVKLKPARNGAQDTVRLSLGGALRTPGGIPLDLDRAQFDADAYELAVTRDWPAVRFEAGDYDLDVIPHAGLGVSNTGGQAEAGATLTVAQRMSDGLEDRLKSLGVRDGAAAFGDDGRWYLFAAASGRAVGLNVLRNDGGWDRAGWTTDASSKLIGDAQVGVAYRKGPMQTSFGYIHREVKGEHMLMGQETKDDSVVAFSLSIKPGR